MEPNQNLASAKTQVELILKHLKAGEQITGLEALKLFGCIHLPRRIKDIKERGLIVQDKYIKVGEKRVKSYWLANKQDQPV